MGAGEQVCQVFATVSGATLPIELVADGEGIKGGQNAERMNEAPGLGDFGKAVSRRPVLRVWIQHQERWRIKDIALMNLKDSGGESLNGGW
jgi:hypothetical protein